MLRRARARGPSGHSGPAARGGPAASRRGKRRDHLRVAAEDVLHGHGDLRDPQEVSASDHPRQTLHQEIRAAAVAAGRQRHDHRTEHRAVAPLLLPASRSQVFPEPAEVRPREIQRGEQGQHFTVHLPAVRPRASKVHRQSIRSHGGQDSDSSSFAKVYPEDREENRRAGCVL